jgi:hypothetical protein
VVVAANHTTIAHDVILGAHLTGVIGSGLKFPFALFEAGPPGASRDNPTYHYGNTVTDTSIVDGINNDGFSFSFQSGGTISNIRHFGSRLALYVDQNVTVRNYSYRPNPECLSAVNGFWIGSPASNIVIDHFTTAGNGGVITGPGDSHVASNIRINNELFTSPSGGHLVVGNVNGLTVDSSSFNADNMLLLTPNRFATGITIEHSALARVVVGRYQGSTYSQLSAGFNDDTFRTVTSGPTFTYPLPAAPGPTDFSIDEGSWSSSGHLYKQAAPNVSFTVTHLAPIAVSPPAVWGTARVGHPLNSSTGGWVAGQMPAPTYAYQWDRGDVPIANAVSTTYTPTVRGWYLLTVTAKNPSGSTNVKSSAVEVP